MKDREMTVQKGSVPERDGRKIGTWITPVVDIYENEEGLTLLADLPGVHKDDLQLGVDKNVLTIEGRLPETNGQALYREFGGSVYYRRFQLSEKIDLENIKAELKDGVLTLRMPKSAAARPRRIEVTVH
jgi:HSP20 family protein